MNRLYSIQFLRFVAAMAVVNHHFLTILGLASGTEQSMQLGAAGVDIFFVISGLVIGLRLHSISFSEFMGRRAIRIFPMLWMGTLLYIGVRRYAGESSFGAQTINVIHSLVLWPTPDPGWIPIYPPSWSLQYELAFYILAGIIVALFRENRLAICGVLILFIGAVHFPRAIIFRGQGGYFDTTLFLEFCAGLGISAMIKVGLRLPKTAGAISIVAAVVALVISDVTKSGNQGTLITYGVPGALLVLGALAFDDAKWLANRFVALAGDASYAIYMTHLSVIQLFFCYGIFFSYRIDQHPFVFFLATIPSVVLFGVAVHILLEKPILGWLRRVVSLSPRPYTKQKLAVPVIDPA